MTVGGVDEAAAVRVARRLARAYPETRCAAELADETGEHVGAVLAVLALLGAHRLAEQVDLVRWRAVDPVRR